MRCPFCATDDTRVIDSRLSDSGENVRRRRECQECSRRFTTLEKMVLDMPDVVKADGRRERFDVNKLQSGIMRSLEKRPIEIEAVERLVYCIMRKFTHQTDQKIDTRQIGEAVMYELKKLDEVAYVRFASVCRKFQGLEEFSDEVEQLKASLPGVPHELQSSLIPEDSKQ